VSLGKFGGLGRKPRRRSTILLFSAWPACHNRYRRRSGIGLIEVYDLE